MLLAEKGETWKCENLYRDDKLRKLKQDRRIERSVDRRRPDRRGIALLLVCDTQVVELVLFSQICCGGCT